MKEARPKSDQEHLLDVFIVAFILYRIARFLTVQIYRMLLGVGFKNLVCAQTRNLCQGNQKMQQIHDLNPGVLLIKGLVLRPPFPRHAISQFGDFLTHGAAVLQQPSLPLLVAHEVGIHADALIKLLLQVE